MRSRSLVVVLILSFILLASVFSSITLSMDAVQISANARAGEAARLSAQIQSQLASGQTSITTSSDESSLYNPVILRGLLNWGNNDSTSTSCAEEDNINIPMYVADVAQFKVTATHPQYDIGEDNCNADFSGCPNVKTQVDDSCSKLYDDGTNVVEGCTISDWWRPEMMKITVLGGASGDYHYLRIYRKIEGENSWPQFLVLYEDGNLRLKPQPPLGRSDTCFGSSIIAGPAVPSDRPFAAVQEVQVNPSALTLDLTYRMGGTAQVTLSVDRDKASAIVDVGYPVSSSNPYVVFRSMYVENGNADVDTVQNPHGIYPILSNWKALEGPWWFLFRSERSVHNTSAPDFRVELTDWSP
jgi:type II secretory pathway pseudopilin PulG